MCVEIFLADFDECSSAEDRFREVVRFFVGVVDCLVDELLLFVGEKKYLRVCKKFEDVDFYGFSSH